MSVHITIIARSTFSDIVVELDKIEKEIPSSMMATYLRRGEIYGLSSQRWSLMLERPSRAVMLFHVNNDSESEC